MGRVCLMENVNVGDPITFTLVHLNLRTISFAYLNELAYARYCNACGPSYQTITYKVRLLQKVHCWSLTLRPTIAF